MPVRSFDHLGTDLAVVPDLTAHDASPLDLTVRTRLGHRLALVAVPTAGQAAHDVSDLDILTGRANLAQAILLRLLTPVGSLAGLGHAGYGSRLHLLIGEGKTDALRNRCRAYVLEAIAQEARVDSAAVALEFDPASERPDSFVFTLSVRPVEGGDPITLGLEVGLS